MLVRFARYTVALMLIGCLVAPSAFASEAAGVAPAGESAVASAFAALADIRIGVDSSVVTIQNGASAEPVVIDYGQALRTGSLGFTNDGSQSQIARGSAHRTGALPHGFTLVQIAGVLLGLLVLGIALSRAREALPAAHR
ncbi:MAG: hypothetical protein HGB10_05045 [Coriobacteriia bacterium]|nr:hypothetical protein [Coriobacteriia bacterium]